MFVQFNNSVFGCGEGFGFESRHARIEIVAHVLGLIPLRTFKPLLIFISSIGILG